MMAIREQLEARIGAAAVNAAGAPDGSKALVGAATRPEFGDYQANGVMAVAKQLKKNPRELAAAVLERLDLSDVAESVDIGPGFINVKLKSTWWDEQLNDALVDERLGVPQAESAQKIVIDYSHPNLAKEMHVGHLRTTIIGDAIARVFSFAATRSYVTTTWAIGAPSLVCSLPIWIIWRPRVKILRLSSQLGGVLPVGNADFRRR